MEVPKALAKLYYSWQPYWPQMSKFSGIGPHPDLLTVNIQMEMPVTEPSVQNMQLSIELLLFSSCF